MKNRDGMVVLGFLLMWSLVFLVIYSTQATGAIAQTPGGKQQVVIDSIIEAQSAADVAQAPGGRLVRSSGVPVIEINYGEASRCLDDYGVPPDIILEFNWLSQEQLDKLAEATTEIGKQGVPGIFIVKECSAAHLWEEGVAKIFFSNHPSWWDEEGGIAEWTVAHELLRVIEYFTENRITASIRGSSDSEIAAFAIKQEVIVGAYVLINWPVPTATPSIVGTPIKGIDVSKWQGDIDWQAVADSGIKFAIIKATEGTSYVDPYFAANWEGAKAAGLLVSAYHMLWPSLLAEKQAAHFLATLGDRKADLPLVLDAERPAVGNIGAFVEEMALAVEAADGRKPFIYTAQNYWNTHVGWAPGWADYPLWVADYDAASPAMPTGWDSYTIWQYSSTGRVAGISGNVDLNLFQGNLQELHKCKG